MQPTQQWTKNLLGCGSYGFTRLSVLPSFRSRGFGFVTYDSVSAVDACQEARPHVIDGKEVNYAHFDKFIFSYFVEASVAFFFYPLCEIPFDLKEKKTSVLKLGKSWNKCCSANSRGHPRLYRWKRSAPPPRRSSARCRRPARQSRKSSWAASKRTWKTKTCESTSHR